MLITGNSRKILALVIHCANDFFAQNDIAKKDFAENSCVELTLLSRHEQDGGFGFKLKIKIWASPNSRSSSRSRFGTFPTQDQDQDQDLQQY